MAAEATQTENSDVDRTVRQAWPGTWEHKVKCFWGRILSQINLKGQDGRVRDVCCAGIGKTCSYLARAPPAGRHSELRLLVPLQRRQNCLANNRASGRARWASPKQNKRKEQAVQATPQPQSLSGHGSLQSDKSQAG